MTYAAIPTVYKGVQMRSRLEARWAAFFDINKSDWQYEPFDLDGWIPDFSWSVEHPWEAIPLFEIKPVRALDGSPKEVFEKIDRALQGNYKFDVWVIGLDPSSMWRRSGSGYDRKTGATIGPSNWTLKPGTGLPGVKEVWLIAGNTVQWKSPRRR